MPTLSPTRTTSRPAASASRAKTTSYAVTTAIFSAPPLRARKDTVVTLEDASAMCRKRNTPRSHQLGTDARRRRAAETGKRTGTRIWRCEITNRRGEARLARPLKKLAPSPLARLEAPPLRSDFEDYREKQQIQNPTP